MSTTNIVPTSKVRKRPRTCPGTGLRAQRTGSSAFPEVRCHRCEYEAAPIQKYGEWQMRAHRPKGAWRR